MIKSHQMQVFTHCTMGFYHLNGFVFKKMLSLRQQLKYNI